MLKQRVITAIVLLAILLPALFYPSPEPFCAVALVLIAAGSWEWGRLNKLGQGSALSLALVAVLVCGWLWQGGWLLRPSVVLWAPVGGAWVLVGAALIRSGVGAWAKIAAPLRVAGGLLALCLTWLAVGQARVIGVNFLLSVLVLVWVADIAAYFAGRAFGLRFTKVKLAPAISPGKSWEGVWGGMAGVLVLALAWIWADQAWQAPVASLYTRLAAQNWLLSGLAWFSSRP